METNNCHLLSQDILEDSINSFQECVRRYAVQSNVLVTGVFDGRSYILNNNNENELPEATIIISSQVDLIKAFLTYNYINYLSDLEKLYAISFFVKKSYNYSLLITLLEHVDITLCDGISEKAMTLIRLDSDVLKFIVSKQFSLKQAFSLSRYRSLFLLWMFNLSQHFHITSSNFIDLADGCYRLVKKMKCDDYHSFFEHDIIQESLKSSSNHHLRTSVLKDTLKDELNPIRTKINKELEIIALDVPNVLSINWDKTLENKEINVTIKISDEEQLDSFSTLLQNQKTIFKHMLDKL